MKKKKMRCGNFVTD